MITCGLEELQGDAPHLLYHHQLILYSHLPLGKYDHSLKVEISSLRFLIDTHPHTHTHVSIHHTLSSRSTIPQTECSLSPPSSPLLSSPPPLSPPKTRQLNTTSRPASSQISPAKSASKTSGSKATIPAQARTMPHSPPTAPLLS